MRRTHPSARTACIVLGIAIAVVLACDDDSTTPPPPAPTMDSAWPNADRLAWNYDLTARVWNDSTPDSIYATAEEVPPLPPLEDLAAQLATPIPEPPHSTATARYRLRFDGTATTQLGNTGQNLVEETFIAAPDTTVASPGAHLLHRLAALRPDLRLRIAATSPDHRTEALGTPIPSPLFLHGDVVYEKTAAHIVA